MSQWTSRRAILRDLSLAQGGCAGVVGLAGVTGREGGEGSMELAACDRPPPAACREETEEEYLRQHVNSAGEAGEAGEAWEEGEPLKPDLGLIRQMLDMVRDLNVSEEEVKTDDVAVISKLSPSSSESVSRSTLCKSNVNTLFKILPAEGTCLPRTTPPPKKQKKQRNAALESILRGLGNQQNYGSAETHRPPTLLTPQNLITNIEDVKETTPIDILNAEFKENSKLVANKETDTNVVNGEEKVKNWMARMTSPIRSESPRIDTLSLDATSMFKKRSKAGVGSEGTSNRPAHSEARESHSCSSEIGRGAYIPSPQAQVYYQMYLERSQLRDSMRDDIWTKAEKTMKQIDERKHLETAQRLNSEAEAEVKVISEVDADHAAGHPPPPSSRTPDSFETAIEDSS